MWRASSNQLKAWLEQWLMSPKQEGILPVVYLWTWPATLPWVFSLLAYPIWREIGFESGLQDFRMCILSTRLWCFPENTKGNGHTSKRDTKMRVLWAVLSCSVGSNSVTPWTAVLQTPPSVGFSRQEYWSGLPYPPPGDQRCVEVQTRSDSCQSGSDWGPGSALLWAWYAAQVPDKRISEPTDADGFW